MSTELWDYLTAVLPIYDAALLACMGEVPVCSVTGIRRPIQICVYVRLYVSLYVCIQRMPVCYELIFWIWTRKLLVFGMSSVDALHRCKKSWPRKKNRNKRDFIKKYKTVKKNFNKSDVDTTLLKPNERIIECYLVVYDNVSEWVTVGYCYGSSPANFLWLSC